MKSTILQQSPARFDGSKHESAQHFATSHDGTKVPYFLITPKNMKSDGSNKTLLYGYGGFRISMRPYYLSTVGGCRKLLCDTFFVTYSNFLQPATLYTIDAATMKSTILQQSPARFDGSKHESAQHFATSHDGTKVPYFLITPKNMKSDGSNKTLLYGYGGFRISMRPYYLSTVGKCWLERGGVYAIANIRGGGEYGPRWHAAALKENRHKAFEDFEAVAEDLIARKVTSSRNLGIRGGSNGGLLMGAAVTRRPELYSAVVCSVPLLDMKRFNKLLAGASWMAEYGNPDVPAEWDYIRKYSPYHNLNPKQTYPRVLFTTSTKDDRVHPAHARKMVAKMTKQGHSVYYYENTEGGHSGAANNEQRAYTNALIYSYLLSELRSEPVE